MNLLFLTFGSNIKNHYQANFAILSFLPYLKEQHTIFVFTDSPDFYQHVRESVQVVELSKEQLTNWMGPHQFFWRVKIKALEKLISQYPEQAVMYLDSDVYLFQNPQELLAQVAQGQAFMHEREGKLSQLQSKTERRMWQQVKGMDMGRFQINEHHHMWNAGLVTVPVQRNLEAVTLALHVCDTMCEQKVTPRLIEQFAISVALQETYTLHEAKPWVAHYWGNKEEWNERISQFFLESYLKSLGIDQDLERIKQFDYQSLALLKRPKMTRIRLMNLVDKLFPLK